MSSFTPQNPLEKLLVEAATDPAARAAFYRALPEAELFIIREGPPPEQEQTLISDGNTRFQTRVIELEGKPHVPIFTSAQRIAEVVPQEVGYLAMNGRTLLTTLAGNDLVMNPGAAYGKILVASEVQSILDGSILAPQERPDVGGKKILLGHPGNYPSHVTEPLVRLFKRLRQVRAAYLAHVSIDGGLPHTLIGLDAPGDWERIIEDAGVAVREVVGPGEIVDFVQLGNDPADPISSYMRQHTKPFYKRAILGIF